MEDSILRDSTWWRAEGLSERASALTSTGSRPAALAGNGDYSRRRLKRWKEQASFQKDGLFDKRLELAGINQDEMLLLLGEPIEDVRSRRPEPPEWLLAIARSYSPSEGEGPGRASPRSDQAGVPNPLSVLGPLIVRGRARLHDGVRRLVQDRKDSPVDGSTVEDMLFADLLPELLGLIIRTIALEVNVARLQGQLDGDTAEKRLESFYRQLSAPARALALLREYPVLARLVSTSIDTWVDVGLEFLGRLCADWVEIQSRFCPGCNPGPLSQISPGAGDKHNSGRSVMILTFASGFRLVYKPRSLSIDVHFQELLDWINQRRAALPFRIVKLLNRGTHGWIEFVEAATCSSSEEVDRFYERQGGFVALFYALEATDFHYENLIASGEHPVPVDLESLFHPRLEAEKESVTTLADLGAYSYSVLRIGLLPQRMWAGAQSDGVDLSGLGGSPDQLTPLPVPYVEEPGTDQMHISQKQIPIGAAKNRPTLKVGDVRVSDYAQAVSRGFKNVYNFLLAHREALLAEGGPLARFASDDVRVIIRPTRAYAILLRDSTHPDLLRDGLERDRFFDRLWSMIPSRPSLTRLIGSELEDMSRGDIPAFSTHPDSKDIFTCSKKRIVGFFEKTSMELARNHIDMLCEEDLERQLRLIRLSLATLDRLPNDVRFAPYAVDEPETDASREELLKDAIVIGDYLEKHVFRSRDDTFWVGLSLINDRYWTVQPLGLDLYSGLPGVTLFLAYLGLVTGAARYFELARDALQTVLKFKEGYRDIGYNIGGFAGWGGVIYVLSHLATIFKRPEYIAEAEDVVGIVSNLVERDEQNDFIAGTAGCVGGLLSLYAAAPSERILETAIRCGDKLLAAARQMPKGIGWDTSIPSKGPLAGYAHGASGMASALLRIAEISREDRFTRAAAEAMAYERTLFSAEEGNWEDQRDFTRMQVVSEPQSTYPVAWCHGAAGIGITRLQMLRHADDPEIRSEMNSALTTTMKTGFGQNHSLCHGDMGNLELLVLANEFEHNLELETKTYHIASMVHESIKKRGWICGNPMGMETPGLMVGVSGIGYGMLRLAAPGRVPSVISLSPPIMRSDEHPAPAGPRV